MFLCVYVLICLCIYIYIYIYICYTGGLKFLPGTLLLPWGGPPDLGDRRFPATSITKGIIT